MVIGSDNCGKKNLVRRFLFGEFFDNDTESAFWKYKDGNDTQLHATLTDGDEMIRLAIMIHDLNPSAQNIAWADAVFLVYSVNDKLSFDAVPILYQKLLRDSHGLANVILVGTQEDDDGILPRKISLIEGKRLASDLNISVHLEVSARTSKDEIRSLFLNGIRTGRHAPEHRYGIHEELCKYNASVKELEDTNHNQDLQVVAKPDRGIPIKQGWLRERDWHRWYCVIRLGVLEYYPTLSAYINNTDCASISLKRYSVKYVKDSPNESKGSLSLTTTTSLPSSPTHSSINLATNKPSPSLFPDLFSKIEPKEQHDNINRKKSLVLPNMSSSFDFMYHHNIPNIPTIQKNSQTTVTDSANINTITKSELPLKMLCTGPPKPATRFFLPPPPRYRRQAQTSGTNGRLPSNCTNTNPTLADNPVIKPNNAAANVVRKESLDSQGTVKTAPPPPLPYALMFPRCTPRAGVNYPGPLRRSRRPFIIPRYDLTTRPQTPSPTTPVRIRKCLTSSPSHISRNKYRTQAKYRKGSTLRMSNTSLEPTDISYLPCKTTTTSTTTTTTTTTTISEPHFLFSHSRSCSLPRKDLDPNPTLLSSNTTNDLAGNTQDNMEVKKIDSDSLYDMEAFLSLGPKSAQPEQTTEGNETFLSKRLGTFCQNIGNTIGKRPASVTEPIKLRTSYSMDSIRSTMTMSGELEIDNVISNHNLDVSSFDMNSWLRCVPPKGKEDTISQYDYESFLALNSFSDILSESNSNLVKNLSSIVSPIKVTQISEPEYKPPSSTLSAAKKSRNNSIVDAIRNDTFHLRDKESRKIKGLGSCDILFNFESFLHLDPEHVRSKALENNVSSPDLLCSVNSFLYLDPEKVQSSRERAKDANGNPLCTYESFLQFSPKDVQSPPLDPANNQTPKSVHLTQSDPSSMVLLKTYLSNYQNQNEWNNEIGGLELEETSMPDSELIKTENADKVKENDGRLDNKLKGYMDRIRSPFLPKADHHGNKVDFRGNKEERDKDSTHTGKCHTLHEVKSAKGRYRPGGRRRWQSADSARPYIHVASDPGIKRTKGNLSTIACVSDSNIHDSTEEIGVRQRPSPDVESPRFALVSLFRTSRALKADTPKETREWVKAIQDQILQTLKDHQLGTYGTQWISQEEIKGLLKVPGNNTCADCGRGDLDWASLNRGILLCANCSRIHKDLGIQVSRVCSLTSSNWTKTSYDVVKSIGNTLANLVWEGKIPNNYSKPTMESSRSEWESWITFKYVHGVFLTPLSPDDKRKSLAQGLCEALTNADFLHAHLLLAHGTSSLEYANGTTALHIACQLGYVTWAQILLW
eukprot:Ihof_evm2s160 gene=Ihof_evmTU2s160